MQVEFAESDHVDGWVVRAGGDVGSWDQFGDCLVDFVEQVDGVDAHGWAGLRDAGGVALSAGDGVAELVVEGVDPFDSGVAVVELSGVGFGVDEG